MHMGLETRKQLSKNKPVFMVERIQCQGDKIPIRRIFAHRKNELLFKSIFTRPFSTQRLENAELNMNNDIKKSL